MEEKLFSVVVVTYKNGDYVYETLESIVMQDYPAIEIVVANDSSDDFDEQAVRNWLAEHAGANIKSYLVKNQEQNLGTTKNAEWGRTHCHGEFFCLIAGDDAFNDPKLFSASVRELERLGKDAYVLLTTTRFCGRSLDDVRYETSPETIALVKSTPPRELWKYNIPLTTFVTGYTMACMRMSVFDIVGGFDTRYRLLEDRPFTQRLLHAGIRIYWLDGIVGRLHRSGGISSTNDRFGENAHRQYLLDYVTFYKLEIRPYMRELSRERRHKVHLFALDLMIKLGPTFGSPAERAYVWCRLAIHNGWLAFRKYGGYILHRYILRDKYR